MRKLLLILALTATLTGCTKPATHDPAADLKAIAALDAKWVAIAQKGDVDGWLSFYAPDAILQAPNEPAYTGPAAMRKNITGLLTLPHLQIKWVTSKADVSGDLAYVAGPYTMSFDGPNGQRISDTGKTLEIWKRQRDGSWMCVLDAYSSDLPATPNP